MSGVGVGRLGGSGRRLRDRGRGSEFFVDKGGACVEEVRKLGFRMFDG